MSKNALSNICSSVDRWAAPLPNRYLNALDTIRLQVSNRLSGTPGAARLEIRMDSEMVEWGAFSGAITVVKAPRDIAMHDLAALHREQMMSRLTALEPHDIGVGEMFVIDDLPEEQ